MEPLYQDSQVVVYNDLMVINKYYFPLATSKTILFDDIEYIVMQSSEGVTHRWGVCSKYLNNWFPLDNNRKAKTKFIEIVLKGKRTRPSITPDSPEKVFELIWRLRTKEGQQQGKEMSSKVENTEENINPIVEDKFEVKWYLFYHSKLKSNNQIMSNK